jgi:hypothetical protein
LIDRRGILPADQSSGGENQKAFENRDRYVTAENGVQNASADYRGYSENDQRSQFSRNAHVFDSPIQKLI